ncbi:MAG: hypothetical protein AAGM84_13665 [Pseudomonadota bacterium]
MQEEFEAFLTDISDCFVAQDIALWKSRLRMPFSIITREGPVVLATEMAVEKNFQLYLLAMEKMSLDLVDRRSLSLEDCGDGTWLGTYQTRLLSKNQLATAPYTSTSLMIVDAGRFRMSSMLNGRGHSEWTGVRDA